MSCKPTCVKANPTNAHCSACHVTFGSVRGFDRHRRVGECIDPAGLAMHLDARNVWRMDADAKDLSAIHRLPQAAETGPPVGRDTPGDSEGAETLSGDAV